MVSLVFSTALHAAVINNLFNTGVNNVGAALVGTGTPDPHYSIFFPLQHGGDGQRPGLPIPPWYPNNAGSRWIGPSGSGDGVGGPWVYRTTFNVPGAAILSTVSITGDWATDDPGTDIRINGNSTGQTSPGSSGPTLFSINSGFVFGVNTLDFILTNAAFGINPTGLRVDHIVGTFQVPEPGTVVLTVAALLISAANVRRSRSTTLVVRPRGHGRGAA